MWSVDFKSTVLSTKASSLKDATLVKCVPRPHRGKAALVALEGKDTDVCGPGRQVRMMSCVNIRQL
jgi:hypothetical protein